MDLEGGFVADDQSALKSKCCRMSFCAMLRSAYFQGLEAAPERAAIGSRRARVDAVVLGDFVELEGPHRSAHHEHIDVTVAGLRLLDSLNGGAQLAQIRNAGHTFP